MRSKVYFVKTSESETQSAISAKLERLLAESRFFDFVSQNASVAVKIHFGEEGNTGFVQPAYLKVICAGLTAKCAHPFLSDTNTLYRGRRTDSGEHKKLAYEHGFRPQACGAEVIIPDDRIKENTTEVEINQKFFKTVKIAKIYTQASALVGVAHFKGHIMTGFGGALKNIGMGMATREGKLSQHSSVSPVVYEEKCVGCAACQKVCPAQAITLKSHKASIDPQKCVGCASCIAACNYSAIDVDWGSGAGFIQEKMIEYAFGVLKNRKGSLAFINFCVKITKECDCLAKDDPRVCPDIGIFASRDPVSIDQACLDAVVKTSGRDIFKELHPQRDGLVQLKYAAELKLGNLEYDLIGV